MSQEVKVHISTKTLFKILGFGLFVYVLFLVWNILFLLFVALILSALIHPFASWLHQRKIPRFLSVLLIYIILFGIVGLALLLLAPVITHDLPQLVQNFDNLWQGMQENETWQRIVAGVQEMQQFFSLSEGSGRQAVGASGGVDTAISGVFSTISGFFGGLFSLVLILVMTFYLVVQDDPLKKILNSVVPDEYISHVLSLFQKISDKLGYWLRAQLILSGIIGLLVFFGLSILGIKYALVLALLAALLEFIPYVGPVFASVPSLFLAFSQGGPVTMFGVLVVYIVIQQFENHLLIPKVMQKAVGLNPIISIIAILIGARLAGVLGVLVAIPVATSLSIVLQDVLAKKTSS